MHKEDIPQEGDKLCGKLIRYNGGVELPCALKLGHKTKQHRPQSSVDWFRKEYPQCRVIK